MISPSPPLSGSELLGKYFDNRRTINDLHQEMNNYRIIADLQKEMDEVKHKLSTQGNSGGKKRRSTRRKHAMRNKKTRKGSRVHKKMH